HQRRRADQSKLPKQPTAFGGDLFGGDHYAPFYCTGSVLVCILMSLALLSRGLQAAELPSTEPLRMRPLNSCSRTHTRMEAGSCRRAHSRSSRRSRAATHWDKPVDLGSRSKLGVTGDRLH